MKSLIITLFIFSIPSFATGQRISFFAEDLTFSLNEGIFEVDGLYYFRNLTDKEVKQMLFYPFPDMEKYGEIAYIRVSPQNDTTSMLATQSDKGAMFKLQIPPNEEIAYRISYGQKPVSGEATYIITTTQYWKKPFEFAKYSFSFHENITLNSISIQPDSIASISGKTCYYWDRESFMPEVDFIFQYSKK
jgi:hypothetical protein